MQGSGTKPASVQDFGFFGWLGGQVVAGLAVPLVGRNAGRGGECDVQLSQA